jgi:hypothetical protein
MASCPLSPQSEIGPATLLLFIVLATNHDNSTTPTVMEPTRRPIFRPLLVDSLSDLGPPTVPILRDETGKISELKFQSKIR